RSPRPTTGCAAGRAASRRAQPDTEGSCSSTAETLHPLRLRAHAPTYLPILHPNRPTVRWGSCGRQANGPPGALVRLFPVTGVRRHLSLGPDFLELRGL